MRRQVSAGIALLTLVLAAPGAARAAVTPDFYPVPAPTLSLGLAADASGSLWFAHGQAVGPGGKYAYLGRLDTALAVPGTSNGFTTYTTPLGTSCCATAVRDVAVDDTRGRVWFVRNDGYVGYADPQAIAPGTENGMHWNVVPGGVALEGIALTPDGTAWFTENGESNVKLNGQYPGNRIAHTDGGLGIAELPNLAVQDPATSTDLDPLRYPVKASGITIDPQGTPWFTEANYGNPGKRIGRPNGTSAYTEYLVASCAGNCNGTGISRIAAAADGTLWYTNEFTRTIGHFDPASGSIANYPLAGWDSALAGAIPRSIRTAADGTLWVAANGGFSQISAIIRLLPGAGAADPAATVFRLGVGQAPYSVAPDTKGNLWFSLSNQLGRLAGVIGTTPPGGGTTTPPAPAPVQSTTTVAPASTGAAKITNPTVHDTSVSANQICVGPPQDKCSLVYLLDAHEYVTGFPGSRASASAKKPKTRKVIVGKLTITLNGGQSKKVTIKLNAKGKKLLKSYKKLPVNMTVTQKLAGGKTKVVKRAKVTFKVAKKKH